MQPRSILCRATCILVLAAVALLHAAAGATTNPRLKWKTISTEHFDVHFHEGEEWTAEQSAKIAEEIYGPITGVYHYEPKRCHIVLLDTEDYANGAAYYYDTKIEVWATNLEFNLRGTTQWLRNVITHEYTHIVSIQAAMKMPLRLPAIYFQAVDFEDEKRPDVINGYPDVIVSYPISGANVPAWWAEGVAQYQSPSMRNDCWDSHRDMILRAGLLENTLLSYDDMGFLGHRSIDNEKVYDHGYSLVRYIAETYGEDSIEKINAHLGDWNRLTIDGAIEKVSGKSARQVYDDWKAALKRRADAMLAPVYANPREGVVLNDGGFMTLGPSFCPDGQTVAFLSNRGSDYAATGVYTMGRDGKSVQRVVDGVSSRPFYSHDGKRLVYAKHEKADIYGSRLSDVFVYDFASKKETRVTHEWRAAEPSWSPDDARIVFVLNADGTHRLAVMDRDGKNSKVIYTPEKGTQLYSPRVSPDGARVLFGIFTSGTRDIASVGLDGRGFRYELRTDSDERDCAYANGGRSMVFVSDRSGIFNVYGMDLATREVVQLTHVIGGAFMPDAAADGAIVYAQYTGKGYRVSRIDGGEAAVDSLTGEGYAVRSAGEFDECAALKSRPETVASSAVITEDVAASGAVDTTQIAVPTDSTVSASAGAPDATDLAGSRGPADTTAMTSASVGKGAATAGAAVPYDWDYTGFQFYPRVVIWDGVPRLGVFAATNEILDRQSLFFGGSYGVDGEFDAIINFELRRLFPVLFMQYFQVREKYEDQFPIEELDRYYFIDYRYDVWSADIGLRFEFEDPYSLTHRNDVAVWWNHSEYEIHLDPVYTPLSDPSAARTPDQEVGWKYFNGNEAHARWYYKKIKRAMDSDINPAGGREFNLEVMYASDDLFTSGEFEYGVNPDFDKNKFGQYTLDYKEYLALPAWRHTLQVRLMASLIDREVDDFFWVYMGGMDRLRAYTYYAIGGRKGALASATYRFPILRRVNRQASWLTFKDLYGGVFYEVGSAWNHGNLPGDDPGLGRDYYSTVGGELRFNLGSFYNYPTAVNFTAAYALDGAVYRNPVFNVPDVVYDPQWRYYLVMGFTF
jgi:Tol biopolymer transport system component